LSEKQLECLSKQSLQLVVGGDRLVKLECGKIKENNIGEIFFMRVLGK